MKIIINFCIATCIIVLYACSNDSLSHPIDKYDKPLVDTLNPAEEPNEKPVTEADEEPTGDTPVYKSFTFIYKGNTYYTVPTIEDTIIFHDKQTRLLYEEIQKIPTLCTYVCADGVIEYFDNFDEYKNRSAENIEPAPWEPIGETPKITYEFSLRSANADKFTTKGVITNNKELYQDNHDLVIAENGSFFKNSVSFTFTMINEKNTTSDIIPKWPVQYKLWLVFFDKEAYEGKTIVYNPNIHYSLGKQLVISEQLSNINWHNRIACILIMMTPF